MTPSSEQPPSVVPATATQDGEVRTRWVWAEPGVWTERMLTALEQGVKGGVWFSLMDSTTFAAVDGWVRMRLRSILRKRAGRSGRGRGRDHQRWPNSFFAKHGYFSLEAALAAACQPPCG